MVKCDGLVIFAAFATASLEFVFAELRPSDLMMMRRADGHTQLAFLLVFTLAAMPIAFAMPCLRAGFMSRAWRVPSSTYLFPRWVVRYFVGALVGQVVGSLALALLRDDRNLWLVGFSALIGGAFCAGAWRRLSKHPLTEFQMPWWTLWWPRR